MMQWSNTKSKITPRKLLNIKWGYNFGQTIKWIEWVKNMFQRYKYWWLVVMSFHCSPSHSTPCLWHGLPHLIPKHLGPKSLGPKPMNDLFARFYCIGLKKQYSEHVLNHVNTFLQLAWCMCANAYTSPKKKHCTFPTHNSTPIYIHRSNTLSTTCVLCLYLHVSINHNDTYYVCIYLTTLTTIPV